jgi:hypothetical protein
VRDSRSYEVPSIPLFGLLTRKMIVGKVLDFHQESLMPEPVLALPVSYVCFTDSQEILWAPQPFLPLTANPWTTSAVAALYMESH